MEVPEEVKELFGKDLLMFTLAESPPSLWAQEGLAEPEEAAARVLLPDYKATRDSLPVSP